MRERERHLEYCIYHFFKVDIKHGQNARAAPIMTFFRYVIDYNLASMPPMFVLFIFTTVVVVTLLQCPWQATNTMYFITKRSFSSIFYIYVLYVLLFIFSHVTHGVLQDRNLEGQTLLAIIEVNRYRPSQQTHSTENLKQIFPELKLRGFVPHFYRHVSVSDLYISTIGPPILLLQNTVDIPIMRIYKTLADT
jgi:hypothetical protein